VMPPEERSDGRMGNRFLPYGSPIPVFATQPVRAQGFLFQHGRARQRPIASGARCFVEAAISAGVEFRPGFSTRNRPSELRVLLTLPAPGSSRPRRVASRKLPLQPLELLALACIIAPPSPQGEYRPCCLPSSCSSASRCCCFALNHRSSCSRCWERFQRPFFGPYSDGRARRFTWLGILLFGHFAAHLPLRARGDYYCGHSGGRKERRSEV
jgi:hypothetical protein